MTMECPQCRLICPPEAQRCDCGYDFASRRMEQSYLGSGQGGSPGTRLTVGDWILVFLLPAIGLLVGIIRMVRGKPTASKMMGYSFLSIVLWRIAGGFIVSAIRLHAGPNP